MGREGIEPPQPKAADLQIDARERPVVACNSRISEQTRKPVLQKSQGSQTPYKVRAGGTTTPLSPYVGPIRNQVAFSPRMSPYTRRVLRVRGVPLAGVEMYRNVWLGLVFWRGAA